MKFVSAILTLYSSSVNAAQLTAQTSAKWGSTKNCLGQSKTAHAAREEDVCEAVRDIFSLFDEGRDADWLDINAELELMPEQELDVSDTKFFELVHQCEQDHGEDYFL